MKIIKVDNFDRETVSDFLVAENVNMFWGALIVELINTGHRNSPDYFRLVENDHVLHVWEP